MPARSTCCMLLRSWAASHRRPVDDSELLKPCHAMRAELASVHYALACLQAVAGGTCTVVADYAHASALLRAPDGSCVAFHPAHPAGGACVTVVSDDADNLAVSVAPCSGDEGAAASSGNSVFILLSATYGVVELSTVPDGQGALGAVKDWFEVAGILPSLWLHRWTAAFHQLVYLALARASLM